MRAALRLVKFRRRPDRVEPSLQLRDDGGGRRAVACRRFLLNQPADSRQQIFLAATEVAQELRGPGLVPFYGHRTPNGRRPITRPLRRETVRLFLAGYRPGRPRYWGARRRRRQ